MIQLKRVLLPTDFSEHVARATKYAREFAAQFDAELHLLHVLEVHTTSTPQFGMGLAIPEQVRESEEAARQRLSELREEIGLEEAKVVVATAQGTPFVEIIRYAREQDIDMVVMGTHGHTGLVHVLMGSVAERVVRKSPCPVLSVRPEGHEFVMP